MSHRLTDDEKFLLALAHNSAREDEGIDGLIVGESIGMRPRRLEAMTTQLIRTNFVRRNREGFLLLTEHGRKFVSALLKQTRC